MRIRLHPPTPTPAHPDEPHIHDLVLMTGNWTIGIQETPTGICIRRLGNHGEIKITTGEVYGCPTVHLGLYPRTDYIPSAGE